MVAVEKPPDVQVFPDTVSPEPLSMTAGQVPHALMGFPVNVTLLKPPDISQAQSGEGATAFAVMLFVATVLLACIWKPQELVAEFIV